MTGISWKDKKAWARYHKKMSNKNLLESIKAHKRNPGVYRGTSLPSTAREELARRKRLGKLRADAGTSKKRRSTGFMWG